MSEVTNNNEVTEDESDGTDETGRVPVNEVQWSALRRVARASEKLRDSARKIEQDVMGTLGALSEGRHWSGLGHQGPADFWAAEAELKAMIEMCLATEVPGWLIEETISDPSNVYTFTSRTES